MKQLLFYSLFMLFFLTSENAHAHFFSFSNIQKEQSPQEKSEDMQKKILHEYVQSQEAQNKSKKIEHLKPNLVEKLLQKCDESIREIIENYIFQRENKTINTEAFLTSALLLVGPPGNGKSDTAKAMAQAMNRPFVVIESPLLANEYQNSGTQNLLKALEPVLNSSEPFVIILEEIDALMAKKNNDQTSINPGLALGRIMDTCNNNKQLLFVATTNNVKILPASLKSRFDVAVKFDLPKKEDRLEALKFYLGAHISSELLDTIANETNKFSYRQLRRMALRVSVKSEKNKTIITRQECSEAIEFIKKSEKIADEDVPENSPSTLTKIFNGGQVALDTAVKAVYLINEGIKIYQFLNPSDDKRTKDAKDENNNPK